MLLLISLESFSYEEAARILGLEREEVRTLLHAAQEEMQRQTAASVLIIEDEQHIAMDLARGSSRRWGTAYAGSRFLRLPEP